MKKRNKKAFIFALDSIFAILTALIFISFIFMNLTHVDRNSYFQTNSYAIALDTLKVLDLGGDLESAVNLNQNTSVINYLNASLGDQRCGLLRIYSSSDLDTAVVSSMKVGCNFNDLVNINNNVFLARRTFIVQGKGIYLAEVKVW